MVPADLLGILSRKYFRVRTQDLDYRTRMKSSRLASVVPYSASTGRLPELSVICGVRTASECVLSGVKYHQNPNSGTLIYCVCAKLAASRASGTDGSGDPAEFFTLPNPDDLLSIRLTAGSSIAHHEFSLRDLPGRSPYVST